MPITVVVTLYPNAFAQMTSTQDEHLALASRGTSVVLAGQAVLLSPMSGLSWGQAGSAGIGVVVTGTFGQSAAIETSVSCSAGSTVSCQRVFTVTQAVR